MVELADVRRWDPGALDGVYRELNRAEQELMHTGEDFVSAGNRLESWRGMTADVAKGEHRRLVGAAGTWVAGLRLLLKAVTEAMDAIPAVQRTITEAEELAGKYGFRVGEDGSITDTLTRPGPHDPDPQDRAGVREEVRAMLEQAVRTATDIDSDLTRVLNQVGEGEVGTGAATTMAAAAASGAQAQALTLPEPPKGGTAAQNAAWWDTLSPNAQGLLLGNRPGLLGNRDGLPAAIRSQANMARLPAERARLQQQLDDLYRRSEGPTGRATAITNPALAQQFDQLKAKLDALYQVEQAMAQGDRQLLTLDTSGERVKAAVAVGNVDTAKHVAVFTPGFTSTVNGSLADYDRNMSDLRDKAREIQDSEGGRGDVAAVTWIGYEAPQVDEVADITGDSVASPATAAEGGQKLAGFLNGIDAARQDNPPHLTALGHSYGSTTTGMALQADTPVNDAVLFGSPGIGADSPADLRVDGGRIYTEWADGDKVPYAAAVQPLGHSPYWYPEAFQPMSTDASTGEFGPLQASHGHSEYLKNETTSQYKLAAITAGHSGLVKN